MSAAGLRKRYLKIFPDTKDYWQRVGLLPFQAYAILIDPMLVTYLHLIPRWHDYECELFITTNLIGYACAVVLGLGGLFLMIKQSWKAGLVNLALALFVLLSALHFEYYTAKA
jgi:hypothetical protein